MTVNLELLINIFKISAEKHNVLSLYIAIAWAIQRGATSIIWFNKPKYMDETLLLIYNHPKMK
ncbi:hypothetical protein [Companilactobacillus furfuricola]|uniref:hypothetical protein n=1 Tax=Companilactobacillus furfuricola TaxID=1462575 RepID=UPI0013DD8860|nr:hypothetical protein [Companilactobacillus furfuricola]